MDSGTEIVLALIPNCPPNIKDQSNPNYGLLLRINSVFDIISINEDKTVKRDFFNASRSIQQSRENPRDL